jgi:glycosyltransferase involved in cell wall biosynthesis
MGRFLPDAIGSVQRQRVAVHEIVVVDNQSTDETAEVLARLGRKDPRIRVVEVPPEGCSQACNAGLRAATGDVIAILDADDLWPEHKLAVQLRRLDQKPHVDLVSGFITYFNELDRARLEPATNSRVETAFLIHVGACLYRRSVFDRVGLFDESLQYGMDVDLILRILEAQIPLTILRTPVLYYRRHGGSMMMQNNPRKKTDFSRALAMSLSRRRRAGMSPLPSFESFYESVPASAA